MSEYQHLIDDYFHQNGFIKHYGFLSFSEQEIICVIRALRPFERPDMYAIANSKAYILEHFEFDASPERRKGMTGVKEELLLEKRIASKKPTDVALTTWNTA